MRYARVRSLGSALSLALALALSATGHCQSADSAGIAVASSTPPAPSSSSLLLVAAVLAFPAAMLVGASIRPTDHGAPPTLEP